MAKGRTEPRYRLVVFDEVDDPVAVRDLFCKVTGLHPTDAMQWVARVPGVWPKPLSAVARRRVSSHAGFESPCGKIALAAI